MSLSYNGTELQSITWNGADVQSVTMDGVEVWSAHPPFLVRMRYDANEATHVKDLVGGYTITTTTGGAIPAAADPFGGNNALDLDPASIYYSGATEIKGDVTIATWIKFSQTKGVILGPQNPGGNQNTSCRVIFAPSGKYGICTQRTNSDQVVSPDAVTANTWHYYELSTEGNLVRIFVDGVLVKQETNTLLSTYDWWKLANNIMMIGNTYDNPTVANKFYGHIYDFCMIDGVWHTANYNVPTAYI